MKIRGEFWPLFFCAFAPQAILCILFWAFGLGSDTTFFNLVMVLYAPVSHGLLALLGGSPSWAAIGLVVFGIPLIGATLYSLVFAAILSGLQRRTLPQPPVVDG